MTNNLFNGPVKELTIEITSKCALACPRCDRLNRTDIKDLDLKVIKERVTKKDLPELEFITLSGNYGDAIYHQEFKSVLAHLKTLGAKISFETNGSGRSLSWWQDTLSVLDKSDSVNFSIDGLQDTNQIYRKNSNWSEIIGAMKEASKKVNINWKYIVFKHNQHQIEEAKKLAKDLGCWSFNLVESKQFGKAYIKEGESVDALQPDQEIIDDFFRSPTSNKNEQVKLNQEFINTMSPACSSKTKHYINYEGIYFPCCWMDPAERDGMFPIDKKLLDLKQYSLKEILSSKTLLNFQKSFESIDSACSFCKKKCQITKLKTEVGHSTHTKKRTVY